MKCARKRPMYQAMASFLAALMTTVATTNTYRISASTSGSAADRAGSGGRLDGRSLMPSGSWENSDKAVFIMNEVYPTTGAFWFRPEFPSTWTTKSFTPFIFRSLDQDGKPDDLTIESHFRH